MKILCRMFSMFFVLIICMTINVYAGAKKCGPAWRLGTAIQVAPTNSQNPNWPKWKAKLGSCEDGNVAFVSHVYFEDQPDASALSAAFNVIIHDKPVYHDEAKNRTFFVYENDWQNDWQKRHNIISVINLLLLSDSAQNSGTIAYTPDSPADITEEDQLILDTHSWQKMYPVGSLFCQVQNRGGSANVKFGRRVSDDVVQWFDIRSDIAIDENWSYGMRPFDLNAAFPQYLFREELCPNDDRDIWTARVYVPGYKHQVYSPRNPSPSAKDEKNFSFSDDSWQHVFEDGALYIQVHIKKDGAKVKFLQKFSDHAECFCIYRAIPLDTGWEYGMEPFNPHIAFPEYDFGQGFVPPEGEDAVWSAQVFVP